MRSLFFLIFISGFLCFCKSSGYENKSTQDASKDPVKASMLEDYSEDKDDYRWGQGIFGKKGFNKGFLEPKSSTDKDFFTDTNPDNFANIVLESSQGSCKKVIQICSLSKDISEKCFDSSVWSIAYQEFFEGQERTIDDFEVNYPSVCTLKKRELEEEKVSSCKKFYGLCLDEHLQMKKLGTIAAGGNHTCVLLNNSQVTCFGDGMFGRLGYGDNNNRRAPDGTINLGNAPDGTPYGVFSP